MINHLISSSSALLGAMLFLGSGVLNAQDGDPIEEIVVFGQSVGVGETRANIRIDAATIEELPPGTGAAQLLQRISGIQVGASDPLGGGGFDSTINMRGFNKDNIGFSIDGIPNGRTTLGGGAVPNRFVDTANLAGIDVSQSAGVTGSPSRQALVGHINYVTQDPDREAGARMDFSLGSHSYERYYLRYDTGEILGGATAYLSASFQDTDVWIGEGTGVNERLHIDAKLVKEFDNGAMLKLRHSYNDRDASGYNIVSLLQTPCAAENRRCFFDAFAPTNPAFSLNPNSDGYTDDWTGNPLVDRLHRSTRGNAREDNLSYAELMLPFTDAIAMTLKPYYHFQDGVGRFMNASDEGAVPDPIDNTDETGRQLYYRNNHYEMDRYGAIFEVAGSHNELLNWKAGVWYEDAERSQVRHWHRLVNPMAGPDYVGTPFHTSEDKEWDNQVWTLYFGNKSTLFDERLSVEWGLSYMDNDVDYTAPIQDSDDGLFDYVNSVSTDSGVLPNVGAVFSITDAVEVFAGYAENAATVSDAVLEDGAGAPPDPAEEINSMDKSDVIDAGIRYTSNNLALGVQYFRLESEEVIAVDAANTLASDNLDQGKEVEGVEFTFNGRYQDFGLYAAYTHQSHEYVLDESSLDADGNPAAGFIRDGEDLVGIPNDKLFVELSWQPTENFNFSVNMNHVGDRAGFYGNPRASTGLLPDFSFASGAFSPPDQVAQVTSSDERIRGYTVFGLNMSYNRKMNFDYLRGLTFALNVENITNKDYLSGVAPELLGVDRKWAGRYFIGAPRSVTFTVKGVF